MNDEILTEERIDRMRNGVMSRLDRPRRRTRAVLGAIAAVGTVAVLGSTAIGIGVGLPRSSNDSADMALVDDTSGAVATEQLTKMSGEWRESALDTSVAGGSDEGITYEEDHGLEPEIVTGWTSMTVSDPRKAATKIRTEVTRLGGRVDSESIESHEYQNATLTVRVPTDKVTELNDFLDGLGTVTETSVNREQVGQQVRDLDARIKALEVSTERLRDIMRDAKNTQDLLAAEAELSRRQAELEGLVAQRAQLGDRTQMATLTVQLTAKSTVSKVDAGGFRGGLVSGWNSLVAAFEGAMAGIGFLLPWVLPLTLLGLLVRWFWRRRN